MTTCIIDQHAIGRRQYALLMNRKLRATRREMRLNALTDAIARVGGYVAYAASIIVITLAIGGWINI
jgi:hypothetical protein